MKSDRSLVALLAFCGIAAFAVAVAFAAFFAGAALAFPASTPESGQVEKQLPPDQNAPRANPNLAPAEAGTFRGMITDSYCLGRHVRYPDKSSGDCAKMCARSGSAYVLLDGDKRYTLQGADLALDRVAAQRVVVTGTLEGDTLKVASVAAQ